MLSFHSFIWLSSIPFDTCATSSLSIHLLMDVCTLFKDSTCKWYHICLSLTYFTQYDNLCIHLCCCKWHDFIFNSCVICQSLWLCGSQSTVEILKEMGIPDHLTCLLRNLYAGQEATVRTGHGTTDWFQIGKGVHQGCILSPCLFNFYAEYIMGNAGLEEAQAGIKIAGRNLNNLR